VAMLSDVCSLPKTYTFCSQWRITSPLAPCRRQMLDQMLTKTALEMRSTTSIDWPSVSTTDHQELCLPGKIVHVIHSRPKKQTKLVTSICSFVIVISFDLA